MKTFFKMLAFALLIFNGMSALYGGLNLVAYPNGNSLQLPLDYLQDSPFDNYFIPGLVLLIMNGLMSLFICVAILLDSKKYAVFILIQGCILGGWIFIQMTMIHALNFLQVVFGITAVLLIVCGRVLVRDLHSKIEERKSGMKIA